MAQRPPDCPPPGNSYAAPSRLEKLALAMEVEAWELRLLLHTLVSDASHHRAQKHEAAHKRLDRIVG